MIGEGDTDNNGISTNRPLYRSIRPLRRMNRSVRNERFQEGIAGGSSTGVWRKLNVQSFEEVFGMTPAYRDAGTTTEGNRIVAVK